MTRLTSDGDGVDRRRFLAAAGGLGVAGLAGCTGTESDNADGGPSIGQIGSGRAGRDAPSGTSMSDMPELSGELTVYSGRGEFLVGELVTYIEGLYDDFELNVRYGGATDLVNTITNEGEGSRADVFY